MRIKRSAILLMALTASSFLLLILSSKADIRPALGATKTGAGINTPEIIEGASIFHWELLSRLMVRPVL